MARPSGGDIWHLSIDDLLAPLQESPRLGGSGPFVINLSASTAPISQPIKGVLGCPEAHVYQIQRTEDRRLRYRLRLGPFSTEDEAHAVLDKVRDIYPGALTATAETEDLRALEAIQARIAAQTKGAVRPKADAQPKVHVEQTADSPLEVGAQAQADSPTLNDVTRPPLVSIPVLSEAVSFARPKSVRPQPPRERRSQVGGTVMNRAPTLAAGAEVKPPMLAPPMLEPPPAQRLQTQSPPTAAPDSVPWIVEPPSGEQPRKQPAPAAAPEIKPWAVEPPAAAAADAVPWIVEPSMAVPSPATAAADTVPWVVEAPTMEAAAAKQPAVKPSVVNSVPANPPVPKSPVSKPTVVPSPVARPVAVKSSAVSAPAPKPTEALESKPPSFESTQTIRPLTPLELEDAAASRWFVIQLSIAEHAFNPDSVPNLDIFSVYRLYSVAGLERGRVMHALRLGFFSDEVAAGAVASYLTAFYQTSSVKRVSAAERERFADERFEARKDVGATGQHAVIEITSERVVRENRITTAAAAKSVDAPSAPRVVAQKSRWF